MQEYTTKYLTDETLDDVSAQDSDEYHDDKITMRRFVKVVFKNNGEIAGFELRHRLSPCIFVQQKFSFMKLKRAIRATIYINRLLRDGMESEYVL